MSLTFTIDDTQVKKSLSGLTRGVSDFKDPLEKSAREMLDIYGDKVFKDQGATGEKWKKLSPATLKMRSARTGYYSASPKATGKILVWTGNLMNGFVKTVSNTSITIENTVPYFKYHQRSKGRPAQRRMLYLDKNIIAMVFKNVANHVKQSI